MAGDGAQTIARIGPNAIIQLGEALTAAHGRDAYLTLLNDAGLATYAETPPTSMVDERDVIALHNALWRSYPAEDAEALAFDAGVRTGDYVLANRMPGVAKAILEPLPARLAAPLLLRAIAKHAWTFAGSGACRFEAGKPVLIEIAGCPLCRGHSGERPRGAYYVGTFSQLFERLVDRRTQVKETACQAMGDPACRFAIDW